MLRFFKKKEPSPPIDLTKVPQELRSPVMAAARRIRSYEDRLIKAQAERNSLLGNVAKYESNPLDRMKISFSGGGDEDRLVRATQQIEAAEREIAKLGGLINLHKDVLATYQDEGLSVEARDTLAKTAETGHTADKVTEALAVCKATRETAPQPPTPSPHKPSA